MVYSVLTFDLPATCALLNELASGTHNPGYGLLTSVSC